MQKVKLVTVRQEQKAVLQAGKKQCGYDDCISVRILIECAHGHVGDMMNKSSSVARSLIARKIAEYVFPYESRTANRAITQPDKQDQTMPSLVRTDGHVLGG